MTADLVTHDAEEFGRHVRQGGWRLGLLVARNVFSGKKTDKINATVVALGKIAAVEFAGKSDTSDRRVLRYLKSWEAAAADGYVPHAADLAPGEEVGLDVETLPEWDRFYPPGDSNYQRTTPERRAAIDQAAHREDVSPSQVARTAASPRAVAAAIDADPAVADAARRALDEKSARFGDNVRKADAAAADRRRQQHTMQYVQIEGKLARMLRVGGEILTDTHAVAFDAEERELLAESIGKVRALIQLIERRFVDPDEIRNIDWDAELTKVLG